MSTVAEKPSDSRPLPPRVPVWFLVALLLVAFAVPLALMLRPKAAAPLPVIGVLPDFALVDQDTRPASLQRFAGKPFVANFIFTTCPTVCPLLSQKMARLQERTKSLGDRAHFVSFSVDPETDTPAALKAFGANYKQDPARWSFLTGRYEAIEKAVIDGFKMRLDRVPRPGDAEGFDVVHGEHFVLVDGKGAIRGYYRAEEPELERLAQDLERLAEPGTT